jgi:hypothetical protein
MKEKIHRFHIIPNRDLLLVVKQFETGHFKSTKGFCPNPGPYSGKPGDSLKYNIFLLRFDSEIIAIFC